MTSLAFSKLVKTLSEMPKYHFLLTALEFNGKRNPLEISQVWKKIMVINNYLPEYSGSKKNLHKVTVHPQYLEEYKIMISIKPKSSIRGFYLVPQFAVWAVWAFLLGYIIYFTKQTKPREHPIVYNLTVMHSKVF